MKPENVDAAKKFVEAIRKFSEHPSNLENLESYLSYHFDRWLQIYANTPANIASEMEHFAIMEI